MTLTPQEIADGWIPHDGGPNPPLIRDGEAVDWKSRNGKVFHTVMGELFWDHNIIAYRLADAEPNTSAEPVGDGFDTIDLKVRFPKLEAHLMRMASTGQTGSLSEWGDFFQCLIAALRPAQYPPAFFEPRRTEFSKGLEPFVIGSDTWTDHATATRLLAEKDAQVAALEKAWARAVANVNEAEARATAAEAEVERLRIALVHIDALCPEGHFIGGISADAARGLVLRIGEIARQALTPKETA